MRRDVREIFGRTELSEDDENPHTRALLAVTPTTTGKRLPQLLTDRELVALYEAVWPACHATHVVMIKVLIFAGLRNTELARIRLRDSDQERHYQPQAAVTQRSCRGKESGPGSGSSTGRRLSRVRSSHAVVPSSVNGNLLASYRSESFLTPRCKVCKVYTGVSMCFRERLIKMAADRVRKLRAQPAPALTAFVSGHDVGDLEAGHGQQPWGREVGPQRIAIEIRAVQRIPRRLQHVAREGGTGIGALADDG